MDRQAAASSPASVTEAVERSATAVEEIHRTLADVPLEVLERSGLFQKTAAEIRRLQDQSIGVVYDAIRGVNRRVGQLAADLLEERDDAASE